MNNDRRWFLRNAGALSAAFAALPRALGAESARATAGPRVSRRPDGELGDLVPDPAGVIDLPAGFTYQILSRVGDPMDDGLIVPGLPDGMAAFPGEDGRTRLVRNHELMPGSESPFGEDDVLLEGFGRAHLYDTGGPNGGRACAGGTTTLVYDTRTGELERQFLSLAGTLRNCAGGPTPWGSWVTCEEAPALAGREYARDHGYAFEVPAAADEPVRPVPLLSMGRFNHEAVAVDPKSGVVFQTEDRPDGLIYRFVPESAGQLDGPGKLQALAIADAPSTDTRNWFDFADFPVGMEVAVEWIDLDDIQAPADDLRFRGFLQGAARFARGEGMWTGDGVIWFACTDGGRVRSGQVFRYRPSPGEGRKIRERKEPGTLELFLESESPQQIDCCDNLTVTPWGDLILCEDGAGDNFLVRVTADGDVHPFARNTQSEFAGATFSPDGTTLFVNIQGPGLTLAIRGPWPRA